MARRELGSAGLALVQAVEPWFDRAAADRAALMLAVSGGADSLALAGAAAAVIRRRTRAGELSPPLSAVVVDHQLQPDSGLVAARAAEQVIGLDIPTVVHPVVVELTGGDGLEAAARQARRAALVAAAASQCQGSDDRSREEPGARTSMVMLAHTLDDQAESVLLGLARGSGVRSLAGMAPDSSLSDDADSPRLVRPFLAIRRQQTVAACAEWGLEPWHDPHNDDPRYLRVAVRSQVMPLLRQVFGEHVDENLARTAALAGADADLLDAVAGRGFVPDGDRLNLRLLSAEPALRSRQLLAWLRGHGLPVLHTHVVAVAALIDDWHGQGPIEVPGGQVGRQGEELWLR